MSFVSQPDLWYESFSRLRHESGYDPEVLKSLNSWAHKLSFERKKPPSVKKVKAQGDPDIDRAATFVSSNQKLRDPIVVVHSAKDVDKASELVRPLPTDRKSMTKIFNKVGRIQLEPGEKLVMVDSGSFCHAIDADVELPNHFVQPRKDSENSQDAESACGGIMKRLGRVKTEGTVEGLSLNVRWNAMKVKVPILNVRKLVHDHHDVLFNRKGGTIVNLKTGDRIPIFEHHGVYYLKMKCLPPSNPVSNILPHSTVEPTVFSRQVTA